MKGLDESAATTLLEAVSVSGGESYSFSYTSSGEVERISQHAPDQHVLRFWNYSYTGWGSLACPEMPRVAKITEWVEGAAGNKVATVTGPDSTGKSTLLWSTGESRSEQFGMTGWQRGLSVARQEKGAAGNVVKSTTMWQKVPDSATSFQVVPQLVESGGRTAAGSPAPNVAVAYDSLGRRQDVKTALPNGQVEAILHTSYVSAAKYSRVHILNLIESLAVMDGNGSVRHRTTYNYDETGAVNARAAAIHHTSRAAAGQNTAAGLATTVMRECTACTQNQQQASNALHMTYNSTGTLASFQSDGGTAASFNYEDRFSDEQSRAAFAIQQLPTSGSRVPSRATITPPGVRL